MTAGRICCECQQAIVGEAREIVRHSASGVRPNDYVHVDPCPPWRPSRSLVARYLPRHP
ncbi:hypothetical protein OHA37_27195 [Streptomyces sp. NBC_00335]|uniref:hypothetical protein n=1 Tax=unclassified Streptomyces TaxID=2593676 RepID=UPI0022531B72|nr:MULTISPECIES: hypothetical protein [unclassified Streptomyces]MCX5407537.1 hypothetical protein [Streptomyces sp. NBC_00086]